MGRSRGKGKKFTVTNHDNAASREEEKIPAQKKRGRPLKPLINEVEEEIQKIEDVGDEIVKTTVSDNETNNGTADDEKKKRRNTLVKEKADSVKEEDANGTRSSTDDSTKSNGFRHNGSRRKNKPRRAAEVGVECN